MENVRLAVRDAKLTAPEGAPEKVVTISLGGTLIKTLGTFSFDTKAHPEVDVIDMR